MALSPKISIVMPVFNGGHYFELALQSALAQTYQNIEVIVVNDGSTDGGLTEAIAKKYAQKIKYCTQENRGTGGALNTGIQNMIGDIFTWLSHDDLFLPGKLAEQVRYYELTKRRDALLFSDYFLIDSRGHRFAEAKFDHDAFMRTPQLPLLNGCINGCSTFIPRHVLQEVGPFDERQRYAQDYDMWHKISKRYDFFHQPQTLIEYRVHSAQDTQAFKHQYEDEGNALWTLMLEDRSETERVQLFGSTKSYFLSLGKFLENTPYQLAAGRARIRAKLATEKTLVSVIIPFFNDITALLWAARSVLHQTHENIELILVNDGSTQDLEPVRALLKADQRVRLLSQKNAGPGAARNLGMMKARGDYFAFLDADDIFAPHKIATQLTAMQDGGYLASNSSYLISFPERYPGAIEFKSGEIDVSYPNIIQNCPISATTLMIHSSLYSEGFRYSTDTKICEDVIAYVWLAQRHTVLGIPEALSVVEWAHGSAALDLNKGILGLTYLVRALSNDPVHAHHPDRLERLREALAYLTGLAEGHHKQGENQAHLTNEEAVLGLFGQDKHRDYASWDRWAKWYAGAGNYGPAISYYLGIAQVAPANTAVTYALGSVLAVAGRFAEADARFRLDVPVPCDNGKFTHSGIVRLPLQDRPLGHGGTEVPPYGRHVTFDVENFTRLRKSLGGKAVYFVCVDKRYLKLFARPLASSLLKNSEMEILLHMHIVNPDSDTDAIVDELLKENPRVVFSSEEVDFENADLDEVRTYYACARFFILPQLLEAYDCPVLVADADQLVVRSLESLFEQLIDKDIGFIYYPHQSCNILSLISASVLLVSPTSAALRFCRNVRTYISERMRQATDWHLDQAALAVTYLSMPRVRSLLLRPSTMLSGGRNDEEPTFSPSTYFWSITYSIEDNAHKLQTASFRSFRRLEGSDVQPR